MLVASKWVDLCRPPWIWAAGDSGGSAAAHARVCRRHGRRVMVAHEDRTAEVGNGGGVAVGGHEMFGAGQEERWLDGAWRGRLAFSKPQHGRPPNSTPARCQLPTLARRRSNLCSSISLFLATIYTSSRQHRLVTAQSTSNRTHASVEDDPSPLPSSATHVTRPAPGRQQSRDSRAGQQSETAPRRG